MRHSAWQTWDKINFSTYRTSGFMTSGVEGDVTLCVVEVGWFAVADDVGPVYWRLFRRQLLTKVWTELDTWVQQAYFGAGSDKLGLQDVFSGVKAALVLLIPDFASASVPPCRLMRLPRYGNVSASSRRVPLSITGSLLTALIFSTCVCGGGWGLASAARCGRAGPGCPQNSRSSSCVQRVRWMPFFSSSVVLCPGCHCENTLRQRHWDVSRPVAFLAAAGLHLKIWPPATRKPSSFSFFFHVLHLIRLQCFNLYLECKIICRGPKMWTAKNKSEAVGLSKTAKLLPFYSVSFIGSYWLHFLPPLRRVHTTVFIIM